MLVHPLMIYMLFKSLTAHCFLYMHNCIAFTHVVYAEIPVAVDAQELLFHVAAVPCRRPGKLGGLHPGGGPAHQVGR